MIYVSKDQFNQVEYLINQSLAGHHLLFDLDIIRDAAWDEISIEQAYQMEPHLEKIVELPTLSEKKEYVRKLDYDTRLLVAKTYLCIVGNNLLERKPQNH